MADSLIGNSSIYGQNGLSYWLISNKNHIKLIKHDFYRYALEVANSLNIVLIPGSCRLIYNEPLFYNKLFLDNDSRVFTLKKFKNQMPILVKDIRGQVNSREKEVTDMFKKLKDCLILIGMSSTGENEYCINIENKTYNINNLKFKGIYVKFLNKKEETREWEHKWNNILQSDNINWTNVWSNLNKNINNNYVKSAIWEMHHLNFWSGFKAGERCNLCGEVEEDTSHIINNCPILNEILETFHLNVKYDDKIKISFGIENDQVSNFIFFHIKSVILEAAFIIFRTEKYARLY